MSLLDKKFTELKPETTYLTNLVVMAQGWKKSNQHIRMTNSYADNFELDKTTIDLENKLKEWQEKLKGTGFSFEALELIPAPKTSQWEFVKNTKDNGDSKNNSNKFDIEYLLSQPLKPKYSHTWQAVTDDDGDIKGLRPIAHISIADQTILTVLLMCLANQVETLQGDSTTDFDEVHDRKIVNYGNRLYCQYIDDKANFSWGNSTTYSRFFADYRKFLERPKYFGKQALNYKISDEQVYEVHLDLEKFYDTVDRDILVKKIKELADNKDRLLNKILKAFQLWEWSKESPQLFEEVCASEKVPNIPKGIPQGLVAGGFLANIYLLDFDRWLAEKIGAELEEGLRLVDCCRYVDDMRLIIVANKDKNPNEIKAFIDGYLGDELKGIGLSLNDGKTLVEKFKPKNGGISTKLNDIQSKMSGPISFTEIDEHLGNLEGLVTLAAQLNNSSDNDENDNPLAIIEKPVQDVRDDTLLRFCANKIHALLKQKRSMTAQEVDEQGKPISGNWDYLQEHMARKFIASWSKDPSLTLLLKKGIEFYPDTRLVDPIIEQLNLALKRGGKEEQVANYCLCEIFRHAATVIHCKDSWAFPAHAKIDNFFEYLQNIAIEFIEDKKSTSSLCNQARFYCLVKNDSPLDKESSAKTAESFNIITKMMKGYRNISIKMAVVDLISHSMLAFQMGRDKNAVIRSVSNLLEKGDFSAAKTPLTKDDTRLFIKTVATESPNLFDQLINHGIAQSLNWVKSNRDLIEKTGYYKQPIAGELEKLPKKELSLLGIIKRADNPFAHENAALKLLDTLLVNQKDEFFDHSIDINNCKISCDDWINLQSLNVDLTFSPVTINKGEEDLYPIPVWVSDDHKKLYRIGIFIRSCLIGKLDWTASNYLRAEGVKYTGIKTSFSKRQLGMMHSPEVLIGDTAPMSNWLSDLLFRLLQWPGIQLNDTYAEWPATWDLESLRKLVKARINQQKALFCQQSRIPGYVERINLGWEKDKKDLKVVMVQSLLPLKSHFKEHGLLLDSNKYRAKHRRHIASVAELILHKVKSQNSIDDSDYKKTDIDLIIWPELAVNIDDIDILKRLVDKTGAIIFTGLTFTQIKNVKGPNNVAMWLIPNKQKSGRQFITRLQGKQHMTTDEQGYVEPWRPYQLFIELVHPEFKNKQGFTLTGSICYDATDIRMSADLKDKSNAYIIPALNQDVATFDSMVDSLYYHMYQHVVLVNSGEFGGSVAKAPYKERFEKLITHVHGAHQVSISSFNMNMFDFRDVGRSFKSNKKVKTKPAGFESPKLR